MKAILGLIGLAILFVSLWFGAPGRAQDLTAESWPLCTDAQMAQYLDVDEARARVQGDWDMNDPDSAVAYLSVIRESILDVPLCREALTHALLYTWAMDDLFTLHLLTNAWQRADYLMMERSIWDFVSQNLMLMAEWEALIDG